MWAVEREAAWRDFGDTDMAIAAGEVFGIDLLLVAFVVGDDDQSPTEFEGGFD